jgi:hypothetical protein
MCKATMEKNLFSSNRLKRGYLQRFFLFEETLKGSKSLNSILFDELILPIIIHEGES